MLTIFPKIVQEMQIQVMESVYPMINIGTSGLKKLILYPSI